MFGGLRVIYTICLSECLPYGGDALMSNVEVQKGSRVTKNLKTQSWTQRRVKRNMVQCDNFFAIEATILYREVDQVRKLAGLSENAARLYLLMLYRASLNKNHQWTGPRDAKKMIGLTREEYQDACHELDSKGFTVDTQCPEFGSHKYCRDIRQVPFYNADTGKYMVNSVPRTTVVHPTDTSFVRLPNALFDENEQWLHRDKTKGLSITAIKVLTKLYEHNLLLEHGGVNPLMIKRDYNSLDYTISPTMYDDIGLTEANFIKTLNGLINKGLVREVHTVNQSYHLMGETAWRYVSDGFKGNIQIPSSAVDVITFRPTYQIKSEVDKWKTHLQNKRGDMSAANKYLNS
jgi:hypothetical protein